jgi:two-component system, NarL family, invasion response regulator UvrY
MIRVLIADDHPIVRQGVIQILSSTRDIVVAAEATSGRELMHQVAVTPCDIVLLDLTMPGSDGLDVLKQLRREAPQTPVLVLTMHSEDQFAVRSLRAGASGYLTKDSAPSELVGAIRKIVAGGRYISPLMAERLAAHLGPDAEQPLHERLSDREYQVLRLIAAGKSTREIAAQLSLSTKTVSTYRARILEKMEMRSAAELTAYAVRHHLAD